MLFNLEKRVLSLAQIWETFSTVTTERKVGENSVEHKKQHQAKVICIDLFNNSLII